MDKLNNYERYRFGDMRIWYNVDELVATVQVKKINGVSYIGNIYVSPNYQRQGLCKELLNFAISLGGKKLTVRKEDERGISIYTKYGFEIFHMSRRFYFMKLKGE